VIGWVDHFDYYGPINDMKILREPRFLLSAIIIGPSEEGFEHAVAAWSSFGTLEVVEGVYAYLTQLKRGLLTRKELVHKLIPLLQKASVADILALQRVLKLGAGFTTCDIGLAVLSHVPIASATPPRRPLTVLLEKTGEDSVIYVARNNEGSPVYDLETMCIIPMSEEGTPHPLYAAYLSGYRVVTEGVPGEGDLCVAHKRLGVRCRNLWQLPMAP